MISKYFTISAWKKDIKYKITLLIVSVDINGELMRY